MSTFKNEFSWSISRDRVFQTCPRQYYFNYYGYWGGWEINAPQRIKQIYVLKQLKNRYMWAGAKVHDCIERTLTNLRRGISVLDVDQIIDITLNQMREEFKSSREKRYHIKPKTCALFEHEYETAVSNDDWKKTAKNMEQCLRNFYGSETFATLRDLPREMWLEVEDFSSFNLNNTKIWAVLDCSFRTEDGGVTIIDWKTGRKMSEDVSMQLSCYAMYAMDKWGIDPENVKLIEYNLLANQGAEFTIGSSEIENTKAYIAGSIADMRSLLVDVGENVPKEEGAFQQVEDERVRLDCNFRKVCDSKTSS
jgi:CRISPR/Cas system-associated exonuclease Cas4 (RecB family)